MDTPVIGISMYREPADWGSWRGVPADLLPAAYADAVVAAGGIPLLLPARLDAADVPAVVARLDGLVLAGGADLDPALYRATPGTHTDGWRPDRDAAELALLDAAAVRDVPTLGVCRGMQLMAVHAGGALVQHVPDKVGHTGHSPGPGVYGDIPVRTAAGTRTAALLGDTLIVPCHHHQAVAAHPGLAASAHAADGIVEAIEDARRRFWIAVQWHPETGTDLRLFEALVDAAR